MKKLLCLLLAMVMCFSLAACGSEGGAEDEKDPAAEAEKALVGFMDAVCDLDADAMAKYVDDPDAIPEELKNVNVETLMSTIPEMFAAYEDDFRDVYTVLFEKYTSGIEYEIKDSEEADEGYAFTLDLSMPKGNPADSLQDVLTEEVLTELLMEKVTSGELALDATEEEIMAAVMPAFIDLMKSAIEDVEIETTTSEKTIIVTEVDGKWLVNLGASNMG